jgi:geranylgeranyl pyrophosphate synthase
MSERFPAGSFGVRIKAYRERLEAALDRSLPAAEVYPSRLHDAMRYSAQGGKRLRALLAYAAGEVLSLDARLVDAPACAL